MQTAYFFVKKTILYVFVLFYFVLKIKHQHVIHVYCIKKYFIIVYILCKLTLSAEVCVTKTMKNTGYNNNL